MGEFDVLLFVVIPGAALAAVALAIRTIAQGSAQAGHWSPRTLAHSLAEAPFRDATLTESKARGAPIWLRLTAGLGAAFGVGTAAGLAPAGLFFGTMLICRDQPVLGIFGLVVSASGFFAGTFMAASAVRAVRGQRTKGSITTYLYLHHVALGLVMGSALCGRDMYIPEGGLFVVAACGLGVLLTLALQFAPRLPGASDSKARRPRLDSVASPHGFAS